jgi:hypothetical protein
MNQINEKWRRKVTTKKLKIREGREKKGRFIPGILGLKLSRPWIGSLKD